MSPRSRFLAGAAATLVLAAAVSSPAQETPPAPPSPADIAAMMEKAKGFTQPGPAHKVLERFLGKWDLETRFFMGGKSMPPEKGTAEGAWLMEGRWLRFSWSGTMMRQKMEGFSLLGHDNFKKSYVMSAVTNIDTAMNRAEGDMDPGGETLIMYGTIDEYLTGEHDKMVKYVWRFHGKDKIVLEVHDLPIGENHTKVVEFTYTRAG